jgi:hypothetical protein
VKNLDKLNLLYIILFFFGQNNFYLTHKLCLEWGIGIGAFRSMILIGFLSLGTLLILVNIFFRNYNKIYIKSELFILIIFIISFFLRIFFDFSFDGFIDFIGVASLVEGLFMIIFCGLLFSKKYFLSSNFLNFLAFFIFLNISIELFYYFSDLISGISYGPFRAYIAGFTINRNPSFFYPIFAFLFLKFFNFNKKIRLIYIFIFSIYILTFFYRTIYVAILIPVIIDYIIFFDKNNFLNFNKFLKYFYLIFLSFCILFFIDNYIYNNYDFSILKVFIDRFSSTGVNIEEDPAQSQRIEQIPQMLITIIEHPFGIGFNGALPDGPIYLFAYYILHPFLYIGWFFIIPLFYYYKRVINILKFIKNSIKYRIIIIALNYFFIVLVFFPYMTYFTFTSIIILLFSISKLPITIINNKI